MNVFILGTGRCGSLTFISSCKHITNYTCAHESNHNRPAPERLDYPQNHIEADNRLSWVLPTLHKKYPDAFYVHLLRDPEKVAESYSRRMRHPDSIGNGFRDFIFKCSKKESPITICRMYVEVVTDTITAFLKGKPHLTIHIESPRQGFQAFWNTIGASGDCDTALTEFYIHRNSQEEWEERHGFSHTIRQ